MAGRRFDRVRPKVFSYSSLLVLSLVLASIVGCGADVSFRTPVLIFAVVSPKVFGSPPFQVLAQSASSGTVTYSVLSGPAVTNGDVVTLTGLGPVTLEARQSPVAGYTTAIATTSFSVVPLDPIVLTSDSAAVALWGSAQLAATRDGQTISGGVWQVVGGDRNGTVTNTGLYTAPTLLPTPSLIEVEYLSLGQTAFAPITLLLPTPKAVSLSPDEVGAGPSVITVTGSMFTPDSVVTFDNVLSPTTWLDSNHLSAALNLLSQGSEVIQVAVATSSNDLTSSNSLPLAVEATSIHFSPATLNGGAVTILLTGDGFLPGSTVVLEGRPFSTQVESSSLIQATGLLPPWKSGSAVLQLFGPGGSSLIAQESIPITSTAITYEAASRFMTQSAFGPRPGMVEHVQAIGLEAFIDEQFAKPIVAYDPATEDARLTFIKALSQGDSVLRQRVAWALQNIFVPQGASPSALSVPLERTFETYANGSFRDLLTAVASDPNIGWFLNLVNNAAPVDPSLHPNQNFGRELMQLFTMGPNLLNEDGTEQEDALGVPIPTYDFSTIVDVTRAFTGWTVPVPVNPTYTFWGTDYSQPLHGVEAEHDHGQKLIFGSTVLPAGQTIVQDRDAVLDAIFAHPNVPPFISRLLIQHMVKSSPTSAFVKRISRVFENNGSGVRGDLGTVVRAILLDPEARLGDTSPSSDDGFIQDPFLFQAFTQNVLEVPVDGQSVFLPKLSGEEFWRPATVFGFYDPAYQIPGTFINAPEFMLFNNVSAVQRSQFLWGIINNTQAGFHDWIPTSWLMNNFHNVPDMIDALNHLVYHGTMSDTEQQLISNFCSQLNPFLPDIQLQDAIFLSLNSDSNVVTH